MSVLLSILEQGIIILHLEYFIEQANTLKYWQHADRPWTELWSMTTKH